MTEGIPEDRMDTITVIFTKNGFIGLAVILGLGAWLWGFQGSWKTTLIVFACIFFIVGLGKSQINELYIAGIFMALACLPYFTVRYLLVNRKRYSTFGQKTRGESLLDAILVFPFCMTFLLKI